MTNFLKYSIYIYIRLKLFYFSVITKIIQLQLHVHKHIYTYSNFESICESPHIYQISPFSVFLSTALCFVERLCSTSAHLLFLSHIIICYIFKNKNLDSNYRTFKICLYLNYKASFISSFQKYQNNEVPLLTLIV